jgi:hypothetical protein
MFLDYLCYLRYHPQLDTAMKLKVGCFWSKLQKKISAMWLHGGTGRHRRVVPHKKFGQNWLPMKASTKSILEGPASQFPTIFTAFVLLLKTGRHNRTIQKSELKSKKQDRTIKDSELKTNRHNQLIQKSDLKIKKQDRTIKESELKTNRHNQPIQKSDLGINRLYRPIQSEDRIGIGRSIIRTFRPPLGDSKA